jgi:hypothetical protein
LVIFWGNGKNAVWGMFSLGLLVALIGGLIRLFKGGGFNWPLFEKILIISIIIGVFSELLGRASQRRKNRNE